MKKKKTHSKTYAKAGVNLPVGDEFSGLAGEVCRGSYGNSRFVEVVDSSKGHFRGPRGWKYVNLPDGYFEVAAPDGIGTATVVISAAGAHSTASSRLLAMTAGDITRFGGLPLVFLNVLETKTLGKSDSVIFSAYKEMMRGLGDIAQDQGYVLIGGETAEMSQCVSTEITGPAADRMPAYNWSGIMLGVNHPDKLITGDGIEPEDIVIALGDKLRSNGISLFRSFLREHFGTNWWDNLEARQTILEAAEPAALYDKFLADMNGWFDPEFRPMVKVKAIAHISGGGIISKFVEDIIFPRGLSVVLDNLHEPPEIMKACVSHKKMPDLEAYSVLNGGQGLLAVVSLKDAPVFREQAERAGLNPRSVGFIGKKSRRPEAIIKSKFSGRTFTVR